MPNSERLDAGPFLAWLDRWQARRLAEISDGERQGLAGLDELARLAGTDSRRFRYAREIGKISLGLVDRVLVAAGGDTMLWELYPDA